MCVLIYYLTLFHAALVVLLYVPTGQPLGCATDSCLICHNAPAICSVDNVTQVVTCTGHTSTCKVKRCDTPGLHCYASYYQFSGSHVFISECISIDNPNFYCDSTPPTCVGRGNVTSELDLFNSKAGLVSCLCNADNCTANITFSYAIQPYMPVPNSTPSVLSTNTGKWDGMVMVVMVVMMMVVDKDSN